MYIDLTLPCMTHFPLGISLLECVRKILEKIVAHQINTDIESFGILPMTQFRSRPHHNAIDAVATLVHCIQAMQMSGNVGTLLLFDISGFFDNINPLRMEEIF